MTPHLYKVRCPDCLSADEYVEGRGPDDDIDLAGGCSVCGFMLDEDITVYAQVKRQIRLARESEQARQDRQQRAHSILDAVRNLFTNPEYNGRELL
jgi:hypothetical protein